MNEAIESEDRDAEVNSEGVALNGLGNRLTFGIVWTVISGGAWLMAFLGGTGSVEGSALTVIALCISGIGLALRWRVIVNPCESTVADWAVPVLILMVGYVATISWLGCIALWSTNLIEALPACLVVLAAEAWILARLDEEYRELLFLVLGAVLTNLTLLDRLEWASSKESLASESSRTSAFRAERVMAAEEEIHTYSLTADANLHFNETVRHTEDGFDETGRRYLSGEVHVNWGRTQKTEEIVVGFCPAFEGDPEVEFEVDQEDVSGRIVNCTPAGIRIALRRPVADDRLKMTLSWYATQSMDCSLFDERAAQAAGGASSTISGSTRVLP